ncbi:MAG: TetR-like C-terminal domain-containing protein [Bradyrhizobium sp.]|nr:TetR-like C-terminal domain-containing protein [Bradyrhizobium sp.]
MAAVATQRIEELATCLKLEAANVSGALDVLRKVCAAYLDFAHSRPVVCEAMFVLPTKIKFAREETPAALRAAFEVLATALGPDRQEPVFLAEALWSALHGLVILMQSERIPATGAEVRLDIFVQKFSSDS